MGSRGPAPKSAEELDAASSWRAKGRKAEAAAADAQPPAAPPLEKVPSAPSWLSKEAKAQWRKTARDMVARRTLTEGDLPLLATYCEAWGEFVTVAAAIAFRCRPVKDGGMGPADGMDAAILAGLPKRKDKASATLRMVAVQLGLTPASRDRAKAAAKPKEKGANPKGKFFGGGGGG